MHNQVDWNDIKRTAFVETNTPGHWPEDVRPISLMASR